MRYLVTARVKPGREKALAEAIEARTLGAGSVAGGEYLHNMETARLLRDVLPIVALIEIKAGLLSVFDIDEISNTVLHDLDRLSRRIAKKRAGIGCQPFQLAHVGVGTLENARATGEPSEYRYDGYTPTLDARR